MVTVAFRASPTNNRSSQMLIPFAPGKVPVTCRHETCCAHHVFGLESVRDVFDIDSVRRNRGNRKEESKQKTRTGPLAAQNWTLVAHVHGPYISSRTRSGPVAK